MCAPPAAIPADEEATPLAGTGRRYGPAPDRPGAASGGWKKLVAAAGLAALVVGFALLRRDGAAATGAVDRLQASPKTLFDESRE